MTSRGRLSCLLLATVCCSRTSRQFPMGQDLSRLPRQGDAALSAIVPGPALMLVSLRDPLGRFERWRDSPAGKALTTSLWLDDLPALPWIERWQSLRSRLSEEIRQPLPDLDALLRGPMVLGAVPEDQGRPGGLILVERLNADAQPALLFARALNAVHPSGQDVEVERFLGIPLRRVRVGPAQWVCYYVLADRLVVASGLPLLKRSVKLALERQGASAAEQPLLRKAEADGQAGDLGAAFDGQARVGVRGVQPHATSGKETPLGVRALSLIGADLSGDLDPAIWGSEPIELDLSGALDLEFAAPSLDLRAAWQAVRPRNLSSAPEATIAEAVDGLAGALGHGLTLHIGWDSAGRPELTLALRVASRDVVREALARLLRDSLAEGQALEEESRDGGLLICSRKAKDPPAFCALLTSHALTFATSRGPLREGSPPPVAHPVNDSVPRLIATLRRASGRYAGRWRVEP